MAQVYNIHVPTAQQHRFGFRRGHARRHLPTRPFPLRRLERGFLSGLAETSESIWMSPAWQIVSLASAGASAYHGYKRNNSVGWAVGWALLGGLFPIITPAIAVAQGFGKRKHR